MQVLKAQFRPGFQTDFQDGFLVSVECPLVFDHISTKRDWNFNRFQEPPPPQRRLIPAADVLSVQSHLATFLISDNLRQAMVTAGLTGWQSVPVQLRRRDGTVETHFHELRIDGLAGLAKPDPGPGPSAPCPSCGYRESYAMYRFDLQAQALPKTLPDFSILWPTFNKPFVSDRARRVMEAFRVDEINFMPLDDPMLAIPQIIHNLPPPPFFSDDAKAAIAKFQAAHFKP